MATQSIQNPFALATPVAKKLKILIYGPPGSGKTRAALTFPKAALIDAEGGTELYRGRPGVPSFHVLDSKSVTDLERAIAFIEQDAGKTYETLIIDPISVFYDVQKAAAEQTSKSGALGYREWSQINTRMKRVYNSLTNLPVHVIVLARESAEYASKGSNLEKVGTKPDSDKAIDYIFDFVLRMDTDHSAEVRKTRGITLGKNGRLDKVDWSVFEPVSNAFVDGDTIEHTDDTTIAHRESLFYKEAADSAQSSAQNKAQSSSTHSKPSEAVRHITLKKKGEINRLLKPLYGDKATIAVPKQINRLLEQGTIHSGTSALAAAVHILVDRANDHYEMDAGDVLIALNESLPTQERVESINNYFTDKQSLEDQSMGLDDFWQAVVQFGGKVTPKSDDTIDRQETLADEYSKPAASKFNQNGKSRQQADEQKKTRYTGGDLLSIHTVELDMTHRGGNRWTAWADDTDDRKRRFRITLYPEDVRKIGERSVCVHVTTRDTQGHSQRLDEVFDPEPALSE
jgi:hypothetical protein